MAFTVRLVGGPSNGEVIELPKPLEVLRLADRLDTPARFLSVYGGVRIALYRPRRMPDGDYYDFAGWE